jgi:hypothetical protein
MLAVLLEQDHGEQARPGKAARQHMEWRWRLADPLAVSASELLAYVLHHLPLPGYHFQCLSDVLAELGKSLRAAAGAGGRARNNHPFARQMRRERLTSRLPAGKGAYLRCCCRLLGRDLVLGRRRLQLLERKLQLVEQPRLALIARPKKIALKLLDHQPQMPDQGFGARYLGTRLRKLGIACANEMLQCLDVVGKRIISIHADEGNTTCRACVRLRMAR